MQRLYILSNTKARLARNMHQMVGCMLGLPKIGMRENYSYFLTCLAENINSLPWENIFFFHTFLVFLLFK